MQCRGDTINILRNDIIESETPSGNFGNHQHCFDSFDVVNDIIELRNTGIGGSNITISLINDEVITQLVGFGQDANLNFISIGGNQNSCSRNSEIAGFIQIQNGKIFKSECKGKPTISKIQIRKRKIISSGLTKSQCEFAPWQKEVLHQL